MSTTHTKTLNALSKKFVEWANQNNINLMEALGSVENYKRAFIGLCIVELQKTGKTLREAYNIVMGDGAYDALSDSVWEALQKQGGA